MAKVKRGGGRSKAREGGAARKQARWVRLGQFTIDLDNVSHYELHGGTLTVIMRGAAAHPPRFVGDRAAEVARLLDRHFGVTEWSVPSGEQEGVTRNSPRAAEQFGA